MQPHEIEYWALQVIDRVKKDQQIEDARVELKATWPEPEKVARRLAGHANAARGAPILWLIGVDEQKGVVGATNKELSTWYPQVKSQFNGLAPTLSEYAFQYDGETLVALYFETLRRPFVVKNLVHGKKGGGAVSLEVPWREGTRTGSASRESLIRLLSPLQKLPSFEVLYGRLSRHAEPEKEEEWRMDGSLYALCPVDSQPIIIPFHHCTITASLVSHSRNDPITVPLELKSLIPRQRERTGMRSEGRLGSIFAHLSTESATKMIDSTSDEVILYGPGNLDLVANASLPPSSLVVDYGDIVVVELVFRPLYAEQAIPITLELTPDEPVHDETHRWTL